MSYTVEQLKTAGIDAALPSTTGTLTAQQELFCQAYVFGGLTKTAAYREAYNVGEETQRQSVSVAACRLASHPKVRLRIDQLFALQTGSYSLDTGRIKTLVINELLDQLENNDSPLLRQRAAIALAKMPAVGLYEHTQDGDVPDTNATVTKLQELVDSIKARVIDHDKEPPSRTTTKPRQRRRKTQAT